MRGKPIPDFVQWMVTMQLATGILCLQHKQHAISTANSAVGKYTHI